jgi:hypothetical protein
MVEIRFRQQLRAAIFLRLAVRRDHGCDLGAETGLAAEFEADLRSRDWK